MCYNMISLSWDETYQKEDPDGCEGDDPLGDPHHDDRDGGEESQHRFGLLTHHGDGDSKNLVILRRNWIN